jgi:peptidoglycan-N-acetylglucosamine deacetylase
VHWRLDDVPYWTALRDPREVLAIWAAEFDQADGHITYTIHPELTGRGARLALLDGLLDHIGPTITHGDAAAAA